MKYIKSYHKIFESEYYEFVPRTLMNSVYGDINTCVKLKDMDDNTYNKIKSLFNQQNVSVLKQYHCALISFPNKNGELRSSSDIEKIGLDMDSQNIYIYSGEDDWFVVWFQYQKNGGLYKCDQFEGLVKCLKEIYININNKFKKVIESVNKNPYEYIDYVDCIKLGNKVPISKLTADILTNMIPDGKINYGGKTGVDTYSTFNFKKYIHTNFDVGYGLVRIQIEERSDDYYIVEISYAGDGPQDAEQEYIKCDQLEGLLTYLVDKEILLNFVGGVKSIIKHHQHKSRLTQSSMNRKLNESSTDFYYEISYADWQEILDDFFLVNINPQNIEKLVNKMSSFEVNEMPSSFRNIKYLSIVSRPNNKYKYLKHKGDLEIMELKDEWFLVILCDPMSGKRSSFYKCDQFSGMLELLENLGYLS